MPHPVYTYLHTKALASVDGAAFTVTPHYLAEEREAIKYAIDVSRPDIDSGNPHFALYLTLLGRIAPTKSSLNPEMQKEYDYWESHLTIESTGESPFHYTERYRHKENGSTATIHVFCNKQGAVIRQHLVIKPLDPTAASQVFDLSINTAIRRNMEPYSDLLLSLISEQVENLSTLHEKWNELTEAFDDHVSTIARSFTASDASILMSLAQLIIKTVTQINQYRSSAINLDLYKQVPTAIEEAQARKAQTVMAEDASTLATFTTGATTFSKATPIKRKNKKSKPERKQELLDFPEKLILELIAEKEYRRINIERLKTAINEADKENVETLLSTIDESAEMTEICSDFLEKFTALDNKLLHIKMAEIGDLIFDRLLETYLCILQAYGRVLRKLQCDDQRYILSGPLFNAILCENLPFFRMLLKHGLDPNAEMLFFKKTMSHLYTYFPLPIAAEAAVIVRHQRFDNQANALEFVNLLQAYGANFTRTPQNIKLKRELEFIPTALTASQLAIIRANSKGRKGINEVKDVSKKSPKKDAIYMDASFINNVLNTLEHYIAPMIQEIALTKPLRISYRGNFYRGIAIYHLIQNKTKSAILSEILTWSIATLETNTLFVILADLLMDTSSLKVLTKKTEASFCNNDSEAMSKADRYHRETAQNEQLNLTCVFSIYDKDNTVSFQTASLAQSMWNELSQRFRLLPPEEQRAIIASINTIISNTTHRQRIIDLGLLLSALITAPELADYENWCRLYLAAEKPVDFPYKFIWPRIRGISQEMHTAFDKLSCYRTITQEVYALAKAKMDKMTEIKNNILKNSSEQKSYDLLCLFDQLFTHANEACSFVAERQKEIFFTFVDRMYDDLIEKKQGVSDFIYLCNFQRDQLKEIAGVEVTVYTTPTTSCIGSSIFTENPDDIYKKGVGAFKEEKYEQAVALVTQATSIYKRDDQLATCYNTLASCYEKLGNISDAISACETAIRLREGMLRKNPTPTEMAKLLQKSIEKLEKLKSLQTSTAEPTRRKI